MGKVLTGGTTAVWLLPAGAGGAAAADWTMRIFERGGANGDGGISVAEAEAVRDARFAAMDADGDGRSILDAMIEAPRGARARAGG